MQLVWFWSETRRESNLVGEPGWAYIKEKAVDSDWPQREKENPKIEAETAPTHLWRQLDCLTELPVLPAMFLRLMISSRRFLLPSQNQIKPGRLSPSLKFWVLSFELSTFKLLLSVLSKSRAPDGTRGQVRMTVQHFLILIILNPTKIKEAKTNQGIFKQELATDKKKAGASKQTRFFFWCYRLFFLHSCFIFFWV